MSLYCDILATTESSKMTRRKKQAVRCQLCWMGGQGQDLMELEKRREEREESLNEQKKTRHRGGALKSWDHSDCFWFSPG